MKLPTTRTPRLLLLLTLTTLLYLTYRLHALSARDPTSLFFAPRTAYTPRYSAQRRAQAASFIARANTSDYIWTKAQLGERKLCVGISSLATHGPAYLEGAVGSLLEGLTEDERRDMYVVVFVPHSDPRVHAAYEETWLAALTDHILTYNLSSTDEMARVRAMEKSDPSASHDAREKPSFDYRYLAEYCAQQQTQYIAIFDDDVLAATNWFRRSVVALADAAEASASLHAATTFLYLRLFYTEEFLGWDKQYWPTYLATSLFVFTLPMAALLYIRAKLPSTSRVLTPTVLLGTALSIPVSIALFFALGRMTVFPLPTGISLMSTLECCSQALVFPTAVIPSLMAYFAARGRGVPAVLVEDFAREKSGEEGAGKGLRWALTPSVVQHVGRESSGKDGSGMGSTEKIWSFGFEDLDAEVLRKEHDAAI